MPPTRKLIKESALKVIDQEILEEEVVEGIILTVFVLFSIALCLVGFRFIKQMCLVVSFMNFLALFFLPLIMLGIAIGEATDSFFWITFGSSCLCAVVCSVLSWKFLVVFPLFTGLQHSSNDLSFLHSFIPSFLHSFIPSFFHSFIPSFLHSFIQRRRQTGCLDVPRELILVSNGDVDLFGNVKRERLSNEILWKDRLDIGGSTLLTSLLNLDADLHGLTTKLCHFFILVADKVLDVIVSNKRRDLGGKSDLLDDRRLARLLVELRREMTWDELQ